MAVSVITGWLLAGVGGVSLNRHPLTNLKSSAESDHGLGEVRPGGTSKSIC